jgi:hypothetical protein
MLLGNKIRCDSIGTIHRRIRFTIAIAVNRDTVPDIDIDHNAGIIAPYYFVLNWFESAESEAREILVVVCFPFDTGLFSGDSLFTDSRSRTRWGG